MARALLVILSLLTLPLNALAQASDSSYKTSPAKLYYQRAYIGFTLGVSNPMGSFSAKNEEFKNSAFAKPGINIHYFDFSYRIGKTLGISTYLFNTRNPIDLDQLRKSKSQNTGLTYVSASGGEYALRGAMLGLFVSKKNNAADLDLRFLLGNARFYLPQLQLSYREQVNGDLVQQELQATNRSGFGIGLGAGLRIHLNHYLDFMINGTYLLFQNEFNQALIEGQSTQFQTTKITYEVVNLNLGFAYRFINDSKP